MKILKLDCQPDDFFLKIAHLNQPYWLDSGKGDSKLGQYSFIGAEPEAYFEIDASGHAHFADLEGLIDIDKDPLEFLESQLMKRRELFEKSHAFLNAEHTEALPKSIFISGAVGYISYELRHHIESLPDAPKNDFPMPRCRFDFYNWTYVYDHQREVALLVSPYEHVDLEAIHHLSISGQKTQLEPLSKFVLSEPEPNMTREQYNAAIRAIKDYIAAGDIYQMNMTQRFLAPATGSALDLYYHLRQVNPAPFGAYLSYPEVTILCSSPERFLKVSQGLVQTRPIKGTVPRGETPAEDDQLKAQLLNSEKDRSELLMIVDLERNDLSKIAKKGTVSVPELFVIESYPTVHHLVSTVSAQVKEALTPVDIIRATFPGGSITGTPKIRAMEVISELEPTARNLYTGAIGYICDDWTMDLNIVIRTIVRQNDHYIYQVGGGIVWDSHEASEYEECLTKGRALYRSLMGKGLKGG